MLQKHHYVPPHFFSWDQKYIVCFHVVPSVCLSVCLDGGMAGHKKLSAQTPNSVRPILMKLHRKGHY